MSTAFLFPGQGAQTPGFLDRLADDPAVAATLAEATILLGRDVREIQSAQALSSTVAVQITTLVAGVASLRALARRGVAPDAVAGLSVGAFAAAVAGGALDFADALPLVRLRAE
ncbi:MAG TPA: acyltransferase domain-containing protein, partial [Candidatus Acidoferrum sp.]|nr:acyltransferase domain-containing protein [Candidatus Acidoferrum sp.]